MAAFFVAFTGNVHANLNVSTSQTTNSENIDPALLERIFVEVATQSDMTCCEARDAYYEGEMEITKTADGYSVRMIDVDGGIILEILEEV